MNLLLSPSTASVLKRCHLRGRFSEDALRPAKAARAGPPASRSPPLLPPSVPSADRRRVSDLGLLPPPAAACAPAGLGGLGASTEPSPPPSPDARPAAPAAAGRRPTHESLAREESWPGAGGAHGPAPPWQPASQRGLSVSEGEAAAGGPAWEGPRGPAGPGAGAGSALVDWSAAHGAFADVLRGMSPPARIPVPGPTDPARRPLAEGE
jgi:hypothetical protein